MRPIRRTTLLIFIVSALALCLGAQSAAAAVTAEEAAQLKTTLTPLGAERAGNAEGTIPAWDGGYTKVAPGYKSGDHRPDPFAAEKPVLTITGKNTDQYKDKLTNGVQALLKRYPDFRVEVYPTHRTAAAPQWVYDNTFKNATRAELINDGFAVRNSYGGIPFPITKNAYEIMLNNVLAWRGERSRQLMRTMVVTPDSKLTMATEGWETHAYPYYYKDSSLEEYAGIYKYVHLVNTAPAFKAGEAILLHEVSDDSRPRGAWQYLVGQRRVRRAPSLAYDTPDFVTSGIGIYDEAFLLLGPWDHHDYKIVGKQEMYIPYNNNRADATPYAELMGPHFLNPDIVRWELHRVWVVEATLKEGKRHVIPKRRYYIDEDTWQIILLDGWDAKGDLHRLTYTLTLLAPDVPCVTNDVSWGSYNLQTGAYFLNNASNETLPQYQIPDKLGKRFFSPSELASQGAR